MNPNMREQNEGYPSSSNAPASSDTLDPISFDRRKRAEAIRQNEELERERRRRKLAARRRQERMRRARIQRIKAMCLLAVAGVGALCLVIGVITFAVKAVLAAKEKDKLPDGAVRAEETALVDAFTASTSTIYTTEVSTIAQDIHAFLNDTSLAIPDTTDKISEFGALSRRLAFFSNGEAFAALKAAVRNAPMYSNGYLWTEMGNIRSSETGGYFYDTDTSYISAICNICLWEGDGVFLSEVDATKEAKMDISGGMTVLQKLEAAVNYLFADDTERGLKYDELSGLVYIHTTENDGTSQGYGSNAWYNFRFGYLDANANLSFNRAMNDLSALYALLGENDEAEKYASIANKNAVAFNEKFWDPATGRYIGCIDKNGEAHDYGFVFLNLEAIEAGLADAQKADSILSWLDGTRTIEGDTVHGADICPSGSLIRNTTRAAEDKWWDYQGGKLPLSAAGAWGSYYQNGGYSLSTAYYDILALHSTGHTEAALLRMRNLLHDYTGEGLALSNGPACRISGDALAGLAPNACLRTIFGLDTDGFRLSLTPDFSLFHDATANGERSKKSKEPETPIIGLRSVDFAHNRYGILFAKDTIYIIADQKKPVRFRIAGFAAGDSYDLVTVEGGFETARTSLPANENGKLDISAEFGAGCYVRLERTKEIKK